MSKQSLPDNFTVIENSNSRGVGRFVVREDPCYRTILFRKASVRLAMPWTYYSLQRWGDSWTLVGIGQSGEPKNSRKGVDYPILVNTYGYRPCLYGKTSNKTDPTAAFIELYTKWWNTVYNTDGGMAQSSSFKALAEQIGRTTRARVTVVNHWAKLTLDEVLGLPWSSDHTLT